ncbi:TonB-dependent receptor domain-containing protein [Novosphingobium sp. JCM 18896]|uniref:TonB-dependent receptor domain-containing protein n=1 Tax=Novosphingobium sp. JCM 18896 TaxID=2989731 RepID=UPI0022236D22|nr:TonB-dependent receptor [Novosphingobium sp. JCM 18896]MCW1430763.1 TonB-dependent receptor [Novosphingobium sp. JCM 18896]
MQFRTALKLGMSVAAAAAFQTAAMAQDTAWVDEDSKDIVVTGSQIRGIAPAGSNVIGLGEQQIAATGATTTNDLLAKIPQATNFFNVLPQPGGGTAGGNSVSTINRPNLRNLPGSSTSGAALTLVLFDGHRVVGAGIGTVAVDPDAIPPGAIERVEAITDGGSAVYGSDAIGGVINFITRKRFDGVKVEAHYGLGDDYWTWDANTIVGKDWDSGSVYAAYSYSKHDSIFGIERDYVKNIDWNPANATYGLGQERGCDNANVSVGGRNYPLPGLTRATLPNTCDISDYQAIYPAGEQHHALASLYQELSDWLTVDVKAYYTWREDKGSVGPARANNLTIRPTNPYYRNLVGTTDAGANQTVSFSYGPVFGDYARTTRNVYDTWNITPTFTADLGGKGNWQLRTLFNYGESTTLFDNVDLYTAAQTAAINGTTLATALNPYDIAATNPAVLAGLLKHNIGTGRHRFTDVRAVLDGTLFTLPGGDVKIAAGGEYMNTRYTQQKTDTTNYTLPAAVSYGQNVKSLFGEIQVPVFGTDNAMPGLQELSFSASGRYDKYNDFGDTFNPKFALTWKPVDWITITANYGKSFAAPSAADQLGPLTAGTNISSGVVTVPGSSSASLPATLSAPNTATYAPLTLGQTVFNLSLLRGTVSDLKPQRTTNWSIGAKIQPPFVPGLQLSASYYRIDYRDAINSPQTGSDSQAFFAQFPELVIVDPTDAQVRAYASQVIGGTAALETTIINGNPNAINTPGGPRVVAVFDIRARNLGLFRLGGIDFSANYTHETGFGAIDASFGGNLQTVRTNQVSPLASQVDLLDTNEPVLRFSASLGATVGKFRAQASLYHTHGYDTVRSSTRLQDRIGAFNVVNLFFKYDFEGSGLTDDLAMTLHVNNVFDTDPPVLRDGAARQNGFPSGQSQTLGRVVQVGFSKKF